MGVPSVDPGLGAREAVGGHPRAHSEAIDLGGSWRLNGTNKWWLHGGLIVTQWGLMVAQWGLMVA